jgi:dipicolinate synthase subunit A
MEEIKQFLQRLWIGYYDFLEDERTTILNVVPTVEGAIELAIRKTDCTLFGSKVLVLGYGRIGKHLSRVLRSFGAEVVVAARKESDLTWIALDGNEAISYAKLDSELKQFDIIFNTVPFLLINETRIKLLKPSCYVIDLASKPGGVDFESAEKYGVKTELALGLPGKVAPKSAAQYMFEFFEKCTNC